MYSPLFNITCVFGCKKCVTRRYQVRMASDSDSNASSESGDKQSKKVIDGMVMVPAEPVNPASDEYEFLTQMLQLLDVNDLDLLVQNGSIRHAPLYAIESFSDAKAVLQTIETIIQPLQLGGANPTKKDDKKTGKKGSRKTKVVVKIDGSKKKKAETDKSKSKIVDCTIISKPYPGDKDAKESVNRLQVVLPWYEYCMYTFRFNVQFQEFDKAWSTHKGVQIYGEYLRRIRNAFLVYNQMQFNYNFVHRELIRLHKADTRTSGNEINNSIVGYFYIRNNNTFHQIPANTNSEINIMNAFLNRSLEYIDYISMDRFIITFNALFSMEIHRYIGRDDATYPTFSRLEYSSDSDKFLAYYFSESVVLEFKISPDSGYPRPVNYMVYEKRNGNGYSGDSVVTLYNDGVDRMQDILDLWIQMDADNLRRGY